MKTNKVNLKREIKKLRNTIFLKCLECCNYQIREAIQCQIKQCSLWSERPKKARGLYSLVKILKHQNLDNPEAKK